MTCQLLNRERVGGLAERARRNSQEDRVGPAELGLLGIQGLHAETTRQLDMLEVMGVRARGLELARLLLRPCEQRRADAGALQEHRHRSTEGAGADDHGSSDRVTHCPGVYPSAPDRLRAVPGPSAQT